MGELDTTSLSSHAWSEFRRRWLGLVVGLLIGLVGALSDDLLPADPRWWHRLVVFVAGNLVIALPLYLYGLLRAPYDQRRHAREAHARHHAPLDVEIHVRSCFITKPPRGLADPMWRFIRLGDFRVTNRSARSVNLGFVLKIDLSKDSYFSLDENPIGRLKRESADGFEAILDNPLRVKAFDTQAGDLAFLAEPDSVSLVEAHLEGTFDEAVRSATLVITDHLSTQTIEIANRNETYQWGDHVSNSEEEVDSSP